MSNPEPGLYDEIDEEAEIRALEEAEQAITEGRTVSHDAVMRWVASWGKPDELPPPKCGE